MTPKHKRPPGEALCDNCEVWVDTTDDADYQAAYQWSEVKPTMTTHAEYIAAIDKARDALVYVDGSAYWLERDHLDTLRAILALHSIPVCTMPGCDTAQHYCQECGDPEPCPTVQVVADALTRMGAL